MQRLWEGDAAGLVLRLAAGEDIDWDARRDRYPPLHHAVQSGHWAVLEVLLAERGGRARVNEEDDVGWTALHWAAYGGDAVSAKLLLRSGAAPAYRNSFQTSPLHLVTLLRSRHPAHLAVIKLLTYWAACQRLDTPATGYTLLCWPEQPVADSTPSKERDPGTMSELGSPPGEPPPLPPNAIQIALPEKVAAELESRPPTAYLVRRDVLFPGAVPLPSPGARHSAARHAAPPSPSSYSDYSSSSSASSSAPSSPAIASACGAIAATPSSRWSASAASAASVSPAAPSPLRVAVRTARPAGRGAARGGTAVAPGRGRGAARGGTSPTKYQQQRKPVSTASPSTAVDVRAGAAGTSSAKRQPPAKPPPRASAAASSAPVSARAAARQGARLTRESLMRASAERQAAKHLDRRVARAEKLLSSLLSGSAECAALSHSADPFTWLANSAPTTFSR